MDAWLVLQLADSAFPTGGFAHSAGLEAAAQLGEVQTVAEVERFVEQALWQAGLGALPFVRAAHDRREELVPIDARCHAFVSSHVANRASRTQGRAFASTAARVFATPSLERLDQAIRRRDLHGHHAVVYGAALGALGVDAREAQRLYLHGSLRGVTSASVRLARIGPHDAQRLQRDLAPLAEDVLSRSESLSIDEAAQPAPLLDLFGATHDRLYARLFLS
jgi:urease accessory protein